MASATRTRASATPCSTRRRTFARVYVPPDANTLVATYHHVLRSTNKCCLIVAPKYEMPQWFTMEEALAHCRAGAGVFKWSSTDDGENPDVVLCGIGGEVMVETVMAARILFKKLRKLRIRVVNVTDLLVLSTDHQHSHGLCDAQFASLFTAD
eukprot:EC790908.1.p1 GENE.EC790908.1~~EC790908.1.p1  ORF type:complete len:153 (+),score=54.17 EC790908.1:111-569(+)